MFNSIGLFTIGIDEVISIWIDQKKKKIFTKGIKAWRINQNKLKMKSNKRIKYMKKLEEAGVYDKEIQARLLEKKKMVGINMYSFR